MKIPIKFSINNQLSKLGSSISLWIHQMLCIPWLRKSLMAFSYVAGSILFLVLLIFNLLPGIQNLSTTMLPSHVNHKQATDASIRMHYLPALEKDVEKLQQQLNKLSPKSPYIVINTTRNRFSLYKGKQDLIRQGFCSTGSYIQLISEDNKKWIFKTPKGVLKVQGKKKSPVWVKPDWAFIEEGMPVPSTYHPSRFERGVLGDYALSLGRGYMIHGTLYKRMLGLPVTHGCIRMSDEDLEVVFKTLKPGSKVFIY